MSLPRHGSLGVYFFSKTDYSAALQDSLGGYSRPVTSITYTQELEGVGTCAVDFPVVSTYGELEVPGNTIIFGYQDQWYGPMWIGEGFEITSVNTYTTPEGVAMVRIEGESIIRELADKLLYNPIAEEELYVTALALDAHGPSTNTLSSTALQNAVELSVNSVTTPEPWKESDYVLISLDGGGYHATIVEGIDGTTITIADAMPAQATSGNNIQRFNRRITLDSNTGAYVGATIQITPNSGPVFSTIIEEIGEIDGVTKIYLRDGMTVAADEDNSVTIINYEGAASDNLDQLEGLASGWNITEDGTTMPTRHPADGSSLFKVLTDISRMTDEHWRVDIDYANGKPLRRIKWLGESASTTGVVNIVFPKTPADSEYYTSTVTTYTGVCMGSLTVKKTAQLFTRIYPSAGNSKIGLYSISESMADYIDSNGYTLEYTDLATYEPPYIYHSTTENTSGIRAQNVSFQNISTESLSPVALYSAADMLALEAVAWLNRNRETYVEVEITDVLWNHSNPPFVGDRVSLGYDSHPTGFWQETWNAPDSTLIIKSATFSWSSDAVGPRWSLTLANRYAPPDSMGGGLARRFTDYDTSIRRLSGVSQNPASTGTITVIGGGGVSDHGALTGLGDDDHSQYWNNTRGDAKIAAHEADVLGHGDGLAMQRASIGGFGLPADVALYITGQETDEPTVQIKRLADQSADLLQAVDTDGSMITQITAGGYIGTELRIRAKGGLVHPEFANDNTGDPEGDWTLQTLVAQGGPVPAIRRVRLGQNEGGGYETWPGYPTE